MPVVYCTVGLPGSGKSTHAHQMVASSPTSIREVSKDDLRLLPDAPREFSKRERWVVQRRDAIVRQALDADCSIVVHDTNLNPVHVQRLKQLAREHDARFEIIDFRHVDVRECVRRDASRENPVGESVIWEMWQRYIYQPPSAPPANGLPEVVLVDLDGTLARMNGRSPYQFDLVGTDLPVTHIVDLVRDLDVAGTGIVYVSGRDDSCRAETRRWLARHVGIDGPLYMRRTGDKRPDSVVKKELYQQHIAGVYRIRFVLDDRDSVVHMWRTELRLPVLQVEYGRF